LAKGHLIMKILLTDRFIRAIKPTGKRAIVWDTAVPGFCVIVSGVGKIDFAVIRRIAGERVPRTWRLGPFPIMSLAEGRAAALEALRDIAAGIDPAKKKEAVAAALERRHANTFAVVAEDFLSRHVSKLRSASEVEAAIRRELVSRWGEKPITEITRRDIVKAVEEIADSGKLHSAHHLCQIVWLGDSSGRVWPRNVTMRGDQTQ
jgi:hypothetical protein